MIKSITVTNHLGESLTMELTKPEKSGFIVSSITGLGAGNANINMSDMPTMDGSKHNSSRLSSRNIVLSLFFTWNKTIEEMRLLSYKYFPIKKKITFRIDTEFRSAEIEGYIESNEPVIFSDTAGTDISIVCPFPYFRSVDNNDIIHTVFNGIEGTFEFPFSNESLTLKMIEFGVIRNRTEDTVFYRGDVETGVLITIHALGTAKNITIYNVGTRERMKIDTNKLAALTGSGIVEGDDIVISTVRGSKYVRLIRGGVETSILNCVDRNPDWFQLINGDNIFTYIADEGAANLQMSIEHTILYMGV